MSDAPTKDHTRLGGHGRAHQPHVLPIRIYAGVWIALLVLTVITVRVSYFNFGILNLIVAMGVATLKASLVVLFFMHLKYDEKFNAIIFAGSLTFLTIFFVLTLADTMERGKVDPLEAKTLVPVPARPELSEGKVGQGEGGLAQPGATASGRGETAAPAESAGTHGVGAPAESAGTQTQGAPGDTVRQPR